MMIQVIILGSHLVVARFLPVAVSTSRPFAFIALQLQSLEVQPEINSSCILIPSIAYLPISFFIINTSVSKISNKNHYANVGRVSNCARSASRYA